MHKVVYNGCYGGFGLSDEALLLLAEKKGIKVDSSEPYWSYKYPELDCDRHDKDLVAVVEALGDRANGMCAKLRIEEVNGAYRISEYDGYESVKTSSDDYWINP